MILLHHFWEMISRKLNIRKETTITYNYGLLSTIKAFWLIQTHIKKKFSHEMLIEKTNNNDHGKTEAEAQHAKVEGRIIP